MYLDAVLDDEQNVLYNSTPENVKEWLLEKMHEEDCSSWLVMSGRTLRGVSVNTYVNHTA